jgi:hypothetical protein
MLHRLERSSIAIKAVKLLQRLQNRGRKLPKGETAAFRGAKGDTY